MKCVTANGSNERIFKVKALREQRKKKMKRCNCCKFNMLFASGRDKNGFVRWQSCNNNREKKKTATYSSWRENEWRVSAAIELKKNLIKSDEGKLSLDTQMPDTQKNHFYSVWISVVWRARNVFARGRPLACEVSPWVMMIMMMMMVEVSFFCSFRLFLSELLAFNIEWSLLKIQSSTIHTLCSAKYI